MVVEQEMQMSHDMRLLMSVAQQLKTPLTIMARQADLALLHSPVSGVDPVSIQTHSRAAMTLVDNYLLGLQLLAQQQTLDLEPVSVSSTLLDASHVLEDFAKQYGIQLELHIAGRYEPVMAHGAALRSAVLSMGFALIESAGAQQQAVRRITLAAHRTARGIVAGLYGFSDLTVADWRRAIQLQGAAQQPFAALSGTSAAGVFVADALGRAMDTNVRVGRYARSTGLAMTFQPSQQLQLV